MDSNTVIKTYKRKAFFAFLLFIIAFCNCCNKNDSTRLEVYKARRISISFKEGFDYTGDQYFIIDSFFVKHSLGLENINISKDTIRILPRKLKYLSESEGPDHFEVIENINLALNLYDGLMAKNSNIPENKRYICISTSLLDLKGELVIEKKSGEIITVKVPPGYPITIKEIK